MVKSVMVYHITATSEALEKGAKAMHEARRPKIKHLPLMNQSWEDMPKSYREDRIQYLELALRAMV